MVEQDPCIYWTEEGRRAQRETQGDEQETSRRQAGDKRETSGSPGRDTDILFFAGNNIYDIYGYVCLSLQTVDKLIIKPFSSYGALNSMIVPKHGITFQILQRPHLFQHPATNHGRTSAEPRLQHEKHERGWAVFQLDGVLCVLRCIEIESLKIVYHIIPFPYCIAEDSILLLVLNRGFIYLYLAACRFVAVF